MAEIWIADWTFYLKGLPVLVPSVVTKKLPRPVLMATTDAYSRAILDMETRLGLRFVAALDKGEKGLKRFDLKYVRKIGM